MMANDGNPLSQVDFIQAKLDQLRNRLQVVSSEPIAVPNSFGRVAAQSIQAFRDSPATDVSAMDGYAVHLEEVDGSTLRVFGTATAGSIPLEMPPRSAVRVFTGGPVPARAQCVVRREDCDESETYVTIRTPRDDLALGLNIRRQAENARLGDTIIPRGSLLDACNYAGALTFCNDPFLDVHRPVRIGIINTGDELIPYGQPISPWQIRDSNGPFLESNLSQQPWLTVERIQVDDDRDRTEQAIGDVLSRSDAVLLTGGVSMGDTDYVPDAISACGGQVLFHRLPIRPGRPMLGAVGPEGQLILGLPGNPLSVAVTFRRYGVELLRHVAGMVNPELFSMVEVESDDPKTLDLTWFRLVKKQSNGKLSLVSSKGSGDIASLLQSDGFIEVPRHTPTTGMRRFFPWNR